MDIVDQFIDSLRENKAITFSYSPLGGMIDRFVSACLSTDDDQKGRWVTTDEGNHVWVENGKVHPGGPPAKNKSEKSSEKQSTPVDNNADKSTIVDTEAKETSGQKTGEKMDKIEGFPEAKIKSNDDGSVEINGVSSSYWQSLRVKMKELGWIRTEEDKKKANNKFYPKDHQVFGDVKPSVAETPQEKASVDPSSPAIFASAKEGNEWYDAHVRPAHNQYDVAKKRLDELVQRTSLDAELGADMDASAVKISEARGHVEKLQKQFDSARSEWQSRRAVYEDVLKAKSAKPKSPKRRVPQLSQAVLLTMTNAELADRGLVRTSGPNGPYVRHGDEEELNDHR